MPTIWVESGGRMLPVTIPEPPEIVAAPMPVKWIEAKGEIHPIQVPPPQLPPQASPMALARRFYGQLRTAYGVPPPRVLPIRRAGVKLPPERVPVGFAGLGIIDQDTCLWASQLRPQDQETLYLTPSLPTIKMKPSIVEPPPTGPAADGSGVVCTINRWVSGNPIWAGLALAGGLALLAGGKEYQRRRKAKR